MASPAKLTTSPWCSSTSAICAARGGMSELVRDAAGGSECRSLALDRVGSGLDFWTVGAGQWQQAGLQGEDGVDDEVELLGGLRHGVRGAPAAGELLDVALAELGEAREVGKDQRALDHLDHREGVRHAGVLLLDKVTDLVRARELRVEVRLLCKLPAGSGLVDGVVLLIVVALRRHRRQTRMVCRRQLDLGVDLVQVSRAPSHRTGLQHSFNRTLRGAMQECTPRFKGSALPPLPIAAAQPGVESRESRGCVQLGARTFCRGAGNAGRRAFCRRRRSPSPPSAHLSDTRRSPGSTA